MNQVASAKPRKMTTRETYGKMIVWATQNKERLHNRRLSEVCNAMRKQFNGEFLSDEAVEDACNTCGITVIKQKKSTFNKKDQLGLLPRFSTVRSNVPKRNSVLRFSALKKRLLSML